MMKEVGYKQNWGEVAPALLISPGKSSSCPKLETILEEEYEDHAAFSKKVFLFLPVVLSTVVYFLLYEDVIHCA